MEKENNMELFDLDDVDLVVSYTIQILFIAKSANSLVHLNSFNTHWQTMERNRTWKKGFLLSKPETLGVFCRPKVNLSVNKCPQSLKMNYCFLCRTCVLSADWPQWIKRTDLMQEMCNLQEMSFE